MKVEVLQQLQQIKEAWERLGNVPADFAPWGLPGFTKISLTEALGGLVEIASEIEKSGEYEASQISIYILQQQITALRTYVVQHIVQNPQPHIPGFINTIEVVRISLFNLLDSVDKNGKQASKNLLRSLAELVSKIKDAEKSFGNFVAASQNISTMAKKAESDSEVIHACKEKSESDLKKTGELTNEVGENYEIVEQTTRDIKAAVAELTTLGDELKQNKTQQAELFQKFEGYKEEINNLIGAASQTGMAASFRIMKVDFETSRKLWLMGFIGAVLTLLEVGVLYLAPALASKDWIEMLIKLPLTIPLIWLGWFFAKQYGYTVRLREDYAFKYASAMSFEAHKREAREIDEKLLKKLLNISIQNFADNPLRIFGHANHASPSQELFESLLKNKKLLDMLKDLISKEKNSKGKKPNENADD